MRRSKWPAWRWTLWRAWRRCQWMCGWHWRQRPLTIRRFEKWVIHYNVQQGVRWDNILRLDPCVYCGEYRPGDMTIEHITPRSQRGPDKFINKASACRRCNSERGHSPLLLWLWRQDNRRRLVILAQEKKASRKAKYRRPATIKVPPIGQIKDFARWKVFSKRA